MAQSGNDEECLDRLRDGVFVDQPRFWDSPEHIIADWFLGKADRDTVMWKWADYVRHREVSDAFTAAGLSHSRKEYAFLLSDPHAFDCLDPEQSLEDQLIYLNEMCLVE